MYLTFSDWTILVGLISFAGFVSYLVYEVQNAIYSYLYDDN
jgi:hypothetical protein